MDVTSFRKQSRSTRLPQIARIEIPLPLKPRQRPYTRGSGPPLAALAISIRNDSTAQVVEKIVLPLTAPDGKIRQQMHYIVQWSDLPAASVAINAKHILDYVSPRTLEDFEYNLSLERDHEEEESRRRIDKLQAGPSQKGVQLQARGPGNRGSAHLLQQSLGDTITETAALSSTKGPSLSTPQKASNERVVEDSTEMEEDEDDEDDNERSEEPADSAIYRQLLGESELETKGYDLVVASSNPFPGRSASNGTASTPHPKPRESEHEDSSVLIGWTSSLNGHRPSKPDSHVEQGKRARFTPVSSSIRKVPASQKEASIGRDKIDPPQTATEDRQYEVKRLEGDAIDVVDGIEKHWFKVRWEGTWPKDQNPTWEPEGNIPASLVEAYLKRKASKGRKETPDQRTAKHRKYASVAEAFEDAEYPANSAVTADTRDEVEEHFEVEVEVEVEATNID